MGRGPLVPLDVVVVGCGKAGENHVRELVDMPGVRVAAVCDVEPLMAEQLAVRYGIARHYGDAARMLERERPVIAYVATPPHSHLGDATLALNAGCHVMVEKPLAPCYCEAESIVGLAHRTGRKLVIGYGYFFEPISRAMRKLVAEGVLGEAVHVESFMGYALDGQFGGPVMADVEHWVHALPGKLLHNVIDHLLNKVTEFVPDDRPLVVAHAMQRTPRLHPGLDFPDEVRIMLTGQSVTAYVTFSAHARPMAHSATVYGTKNTMHLDFLAGTLTLRSAPGLPGALGRIGASFDQAWQHTRAGASNILRFARSDFHSMAGLRHLMERFHQSVRDDTPPPIAPAEMLRISRIVDDVCAQLDVSRQAR